MYTSVVYAADKRATRLVGSTDSSTTRYGSAGIASDICRGELGDEDVIAAPVIPVDNDLHGKDGLETFLEAQKYRRKKTWLSTAQVSEVTKPLHAVSQKHVHKLIESLESSKYQYDVYLLTIANSAARRFRAM